MREAIALLINDIHVNKDNIAEFNLNWDEMLSVCRQKNICDVVVGGDMFTSRASQTLSTLLAVRKALDRAVAQGLYVTIAEGNHDCVNQEAYEGYNHLWVGLKNIEVIDTHKIIAWEGCDYILLTMSYFPENGSFADKLSTAVAALEKEGHCKENTILYIHEGVHGALGDFDIDGELPQDLFTGFKAVLCGHYHNQVKIKGTNIEYIGSSRQGNFGEDEEKGYTVLYDDGTWEFVKNKVNMRYRTIELGADEIDDFQMVKDNRYKTKVKVKCDEKQAKLFDKKKVIGLGFDKVEVIADTIVSKETAASGIQEKYDKQGIKREYQNYCNDNAIDSKLGIKYLEG